MKYQVLKFCNLAVGGGSFWRYSELSVQTAPSLALHGAPSSGLESGQESKGDDEEEDAFGKTAQHQRPSDKIPLKEGGPAHSQAFRHPGPIPADPAPTTSVAPELPPIALGWRGGWGGWGSGGYAPRRWRCLTRRRGRAVRTLASPAPKRQSRRGRKRWTCCNQRLSDEQTRDTTR